MCVGIFRRKRGAGKKKSFLQKRCRLPRIENSVSLQVIERNHGNGSISLNRTPVEERQHLTTFF
jgi:hypothetical protein